MYNTPQVVFSSAPFFGPPGGPSSSSKPVIEVIEQDGSFSSSFEFKEFGIISASFVRSGRIRASAADSYVVSDSAFDDADEAEQQV